MHNDKVSINKRLVCETFVAQHWRLTMVTSKFLAGVSCNSLICTVFLCLLDIAYCNREYAILALYCVALREFATVLFVGVHLLMVISYVSGRRGTEILHLRQKATPSLRHPNFQFWIHPF